MDIRIVLIDSPLYSLIKLSLKIKKDDVIELFYKKSMVTPNFFKKKLDW